MFKQNNSSGSSSKGVNPASMVNIVGAETVIEGSIVAEGDIRIDGHVKGSLRSKSKVVIGHTGIIDGDITCLNADVSGKVIGRVSVTELLSLKSTAIVEGDIVTSKLVVEADAKFNGNCRMGAVIKGMEQEKVYELAAQKQ